MNKYDLVLKEKPGIEALSLDEIKELFEKLDGKEGFPLDLQAYEHECAAMGFITPEAAEKLDYSYEEYAGLHDFIANILDDMDNENPDCEYEFKGIKIWLSR